MQRWCSKFRSVAATVVRSQSSFPKPLIQQQQRLFHSVNKTLIISPPSFAAAPRPLIFSQLTSSSSSSLPVLTTQVRHLTLKQRKRKLKCRQPPSPIVSKLKKYKIKPYSSFKGRFRTMKDGQIRRWKEGKRHNAHLKSKIAKRRGRLPALVPAAYANVMKKLNFCGHGNVAASRIIIGRSQWTSGISNGVLNFPVWSYLSTLSQLYSKHLKQGPHVCACPDIIRPGKLS
nr:hypothetical protein [Tanacetum cinerariifolium]